MPAEDVRNTATHEPGRPQPPFDKLGRRITPPGLCTGGQIRLPGDLCQPRLPAEFSSQALELSRRQATFASLAGRPLRVRPPENELPGLCTSRPDSAGWPLEIRGLPTCLCIAGAFTSAFAAPTRLRGVTCVSAQLTGSSDDILGIDPFRPRQCRAQAGRIETPTSAQFDSPLVREPDDPSASPTRPRSTHHRNQTKTKDRPSPSTARRNPRAHRRPRQTKPQDGPSARK